MCGGCFEFGLPCYIFWFRCDLMELLGCMGCFVWQVCVFSGCCYSVWFV